MSESPWIRSAELMSVGESGLLVVDMQEKLLPALASARRVLWNVGRLVDGATLLGLPVVAERAVPARAWPHGVRLGPTRGPSHRESHLQLPRLRGGVRPPAGRRHSQALGLRPGNPRLCPTNGVGPIGRRLAGLRGGRRGRLAAGDRLSHRSDADGLLPGPRSPRPRPPLFEWCRDGRPPEFKAISRLVREAGAGVVGSG